MYELREAKTFENIDKNDKRFENGGVQIYQDPDGSMQSQEWFQSPDNQTIYNKKWYSKVRRMPMQSHEAIQAVIRSFETEKFEFKWIS